MSTETSFSFNVAYCYSKCVNFNHRQNFNQCRFTCPRGRQKITKTVLNFFIMVDTEKLESLTGTQIQWRYCGTS